MSTKRLVVSLDAKGLDADGEGTFEGYGSVFHVKDSYGDVVMPGAFTRTLADAQSKGRPPAMLWQHDYDRPIGVWESMREDGHGLVVKGRIATQTRDGRDAYELLKLGALTGLSIGYRTKKSVWDEPSKTRQLTDVDLYEVSPVVFPANDAARVSAVKGDGLPTVRELEDALRDAGLSRKQAKAILADGWKALRDAALDDEDAVVQTLRQAAKELRA
jgi:HK97 family phage prohead protease